MSPSDLAAADGVAKESKFNKEDSNAKTWKTEGCIVIIIIMCL